MHLICLKNEASPAALESRNDEQTATDRNQVLEQSNVEIWLAQGPYEPNAGRIAGETTNDSTDQLASVLSTLAYLGPDLCTDHL